MKPSSPSLLPAIAVLTAFAGAAAAQTTPPAPPAVVTPAAVPAVTPQEAAQLEAQIHAALVQASAGAFAVPPRPVQMTADGDHYNARIPFGHVAGLQPPDAAFTAQVKPLGGTRWEIDNQQLPPDFTFNTTEMVPDAPDEKSPSQTGKHRETVNYHIKLGSQTSSGTLDTSFATPTASQATIAPFDMEKTGGASPSVTHFDRFTSVTKVTPVAMAAPGGEPRVDTTLDGTGEGYAGKNLLPDGTTFTLTADKVHILSTIDGFSYSKGVGFLAVASVAAKESPETTGPNNTLSPADKAKLRPVLAASIGLLTGAKIDESAQGVHYDFGGHQGSIGTIDVEIDGQAPRDMLTAAMTVTLDGLTLAELPPQFASYVPTHITLHPTIANVSVADLTQMARDQLAATAPGAPPPRTGMAAAMALFSHGGIKLGLDSVALDVAGTQFTGTGQFNLTGPQTIAGQAEIRARGLDDLIQKAQNDPLLAQGVPVMIFLKGIAKTSGDQAVWLITVANKQVLVNGVDIGKMAGR